MLACLPFLVAHHFQPIPTFYSELFAILLGIGLIVIAAWRYGLSFGAPLLSPLIWIALIGLQILIGPKPRMHDVFGFVGYVVWAILLAAALKQFMTRMPDFKLENIFAAGLLTGASLNALAAILQMSVDNVPGVFYPIEKTLTGNLAQRNLLFSYLMFGIISAIHLYGAGRMPKLALAGLLILLTFAINLSGSRAVLIYTAVLFATIGLARYLEMSRRHIFGIILAVIGVILFQLIHPLVITLIPGLGESIVERFQAQGAVDSVRLNMLIVAGQMVADHPLLGAGLGTFDQHMFWQPIDASGLQHHLTNASHAHNIVAQLTSELGLLALIPLITLLVTLYSRSAVKGQAVWWVWMVTTMLIIHSLVEYPLWYAHFLGIFAFLVAVVVPNQQNSLVSAIKLRATIAISTTVILFCIAWTVNDYRRLENYPTASITPVQLEKAFKEITANPLIGHFAQNFLAVNVSPTSFRIQEKLTLCRQSIEDFADEFVIKACLPIYELAGQVEEARNLRERLSLNGLQHQSAPLE